MAARAVWEILDRYVPEEDEARAAGAPVAVILSVCLRISSATSSISVGARTSTPMRWRSAIMSGINASDFVGRPRIELANIALG